MHACRKDTEEYIAIVESERTALSRSLLMKRKERTNYMESIILEALRPVMIRAITFRKLLLKAL
jgi:hypothetical protein